MKIDFMEIAKSLIAELQKEGIVAYLWTRASTNSVYIRFEDPRFGSIRISDHQGISKYQYKYNIRSDIKGVGKWRRYKETWRYYQPINSWQEIVPVIVKRSQNIVKYNHGSNY